MTLMHIRPQDNSIYTSFEELIDSLFGTFDSVCIPKRTTESFPKLDRFEMRSEDGEVVGHKIHGTVPGWSKNDIKVSVEVQDGIGMLNISADAQEVDEGRVSQGIKRSAFKRSTALSPVNRYNTEAITASVENGILEIQIPFADYVLKKDTVDIQVN